MDNAESAGKRFCEGDLLEKVSPRAPPKTQLIQRYGAQKPSAIPLGACTSLSCSEVSRKEKNGEFLGDGGMGEGDLSCKKGPFPTDYFRKSVGKYHR